MINVTSTNLKASTSHTINAFLATKEQVDKLSKTTIRFYKSKLKIYADFCGEDFAEIDKSILRNCFDHYARTHQLSSVRALHTAVKVFYNWYENEVRDYVKYTNPMLHLKAPRVPPKVISPVSLDDINIMLKHCNTPRSELILLFLLDTGCRATEFLALNVSDVDIISGTVHLKHTKGDKPRVVFISARTRKTLKKYLRERKVQTDILFTTSVGKPLSYSALNAFLKRLAKKAGVKSVNPHDFRRACAVNLLLSGASLEMVRVYLGHSSYAVLTQYLKHTDNDIMLSHRQHSPVDRLSR